MSNRLPITGEYPPNWDEIGDRVRAETGNRCIRCGHPFEVGKQGRGEWSPCDLRCSHAGPFGVLKDGAISLISDGLIRWHKVECNQIFARWRILTCHHLDGNKSNCVWWNLLALCQRCHLTIQSRLNPEIPYFLEHSAWFQPYVAGFYAKKYEGRSIDRAEAFRRLDELLAYERIA